MKKLTAMLLSLVMCCSLLAIPAHMASIPVPDGPGIIDVGGPKTPINPGDSDEPGITVQGGEDGLPLPADDLPGVC